MRYIDADALLKYKTDHEMISTHLIYNAPTADVRENVMGEWINTTSGEHYKCSQCGTLAPIWIDESNSCEYYKDISEWLSDFCPNCGADMRPSSALSENAEIDSNIKRGEAND